MKDMADMTELVIDHVAHVLDHKDGCVYINDLPIKGLVVDMDGGRDTKVNLKLPRDKFPNVASDVTLIELVSAFVVRLIFGFEVKKSYVIEWNTITVDGIKSAGLPFLEVDRKLFDYHAAIESLH